MLWWAASVGGLSDGAEGRRLLSVWWVPVWFRCGGSGGLGGEVVSEAVWWGLVVGGRVGRRGEVDSFAMSVSGDGALMLVVPS